MGQEEVLASPLLSKQASAKEYRGQLRGTVILLNTAAFIQAISETILPSVFNELAEDLHVSPAQLGFVQTCRMLTQALFSLVAAYLVMQGMNRPRIIGLGTALCSVTTAGTGLAYRYGVLATCRTIDGIGLAVVVPAVQSMMADAHAEEDRGFAFGAMAVAYGLGSLLGNMFAITMAGTTFMGVPGWRIAFLVMAFLGALVGLVVYLFAKDPDPMRAEGKDDEDASVLPVSVNAEDEAPLLTRRMKPRSRDLQDLVRDVLWVFRIDTFKAIILQGLIGSYPWQAMNFLTMFLELVGFSHMQAAFLMASFMISISGGAWLGGYVGDVAARRLPDSGRIICAQFSAFSLAPLFYIILCLLPRDPQLFFRFQLTFVVGGLFIAWSQPATNSPIFAEIVPAKIRTTVFAADRMMESLLAAFGPWFVGIIAEKVFGYDLAGHASKEKDASALGAALLWNIALPALLCSISYSWMYWTYPRDKRKALQRQLS